MSDETESEDRVLEDVARPDVTALASTVISVLNGRSAEPASRPRQRLVEALLAAVLDDRPFSAERTMHALDDSRLETDQLVDMYIPAAACELGRLWDEDLIGFAKVTIGVARLQNLLTLVAPPWSDASDIAADTRNVLMILQDNDSHTLGPHIATAQLRRLGASVRVEYGASIVNLIERLRQEDYDLVLFSCSRSDALETIGQMVKRIRTGVKDVPPIALGGLVVGLTDRAMEITGVDLVSSDVRVAYRMCKRAKQTNKAGSVG